MRITARHLRHGFAAACLALLLANGVQAAPPGSHIYIPFTLNLSGGGSQGVWLADTANLGNPPYQITNQVLDGSGSVAILDDWSYSNSTHLASNVIPQMLVYSVAGHLYKVSLSSIVPVMQFSTGSYAELCTLTALDQRPFAASKSYVQAVVEPTGSLNNCASGLGMQTWLIPASADNTVAPTIEPANWSVLGAFTDTGNGSFVNWIVWTGNEVDSYGANFSSHTTLLVGPPAGPAPQLFGREDGTAFLRSPADDGVTHTDTIYRVNAGGSGMVASFSYSDASPCANAVGGAMLDAGLGIVSMAESTNTGYAVYALPVAGGAASQIYADNSGGECGSISGDNPSAGHLGLNEFDTGTGFQHVIGISEAGPANQAPVFLAGGVNLNAFLRYTINGHFWINVTDFSVSPVHYTTIVADGNGAILQTYTNSRNGDDIWGGFTPRTTNPGVQRDVVYLFSPAGGLPCTGGTLRAINPSSFAVTTISGLPSDACSALAYGWQPASVGYVQEAGGGAPVEIDPAGGHMYLLLGPDPAGLFLNLALLPGYPFY